MVQLDIIQMTDRKAVLEIQDASPAFVNTLRRTLIADVPKLAIEFVTFYDNTSALFDEIIAHRLGLLPVPTDLEYYEPVPEGATDLDEHPRSVLRFTLSKEGPCTVFSGDLQCQDPNIRIADPDIPIVELLANQRLILEAEAILGTGSQHAKFQPVSGVGYKYKPIVEIDNSKFDAKTKRAVIDACSTNVLKDAAGKVICEDEWGVALNDDLEKAYAKAAGVDVNDKAALGIRLRSDDRHFRFQFETDGSLTPYQALKAALVITSEKYDVLGKLITSKVK